MAVLLALFARDARDGGTAASLACGSITGKVFDKRTPELLEGITIGARAYFRLSCGTLQVGC